MNEKIALSIIIPTHNRPDLLPRAVASALAGCGDFAEVVVIEDGGNNAGEALATFKDDSRLTLIANQGPRGASGARNHGAHVAVGNILLFLDDDDEIIENYPARVLEIASTSSAKWGFAQQFLRKSSTSEENIEVIRKSAWSGGLPNIRVPFRRKIVALSSGFWIKKSLFNDIGGLCHDQIIDEDMDLCCRLIGASHEPWFEPCPVIILDRNEDIVRLTNQTQASVRAECYLRTFLRNIRSCSGIKGAPAFLAFRAQRMILRSGRIEMLAVLRSEIRSPWLKFGLRLKHIVFLMQGALSLR